jgi:tetratricopeptide (TPR) repeat protein
VRWSYRVHEQILPGIRRAGHEVHFTDIAIAHTGYVDPALRRKKTERNLRLLHVEYAEQPDDPFTLFNLGWAYQELGQIDKALPLLCRSLERSQPGDSIVRKLYVLITHAHHRLGRLREALAVCRAGRARCPDDPELLSLEAGILEELGDLDGAAALLRQLVNLPPGTHFASRDMGLAGPRARQRLASVLGKRGRVAEAEMECRALLAEQPDFAPAWVELGRLHAFPRIRRAVPGTMVKVFSGMGVYQIPEAEDQARFGGPYRRCRETEGVEYAGPRPQPELAAELASASVLAYPNSYPETSCIAVLEAMAAGCLVVTSERWALPETSAGFARLVPTDGGRETYVERFVAETVQALSWLAGPDTAEVEEQLRRQVTHVNERHTWTALADAWVGWLSRLRAGVVR